MLGAVVSRCSATSDPSAPTRFSSGRRRGGMKRRGALPSTFAAILLVVILLDERLIPAAIGEIVPAPKVRASLFLRCPHPRAAAEAYVQVRPRQSAKPTSIAVVIARMVSSVIEGMPRIFSDALPRTSKSGAPIMAPPTPATADLLAPARRSSLWLDSLSLGDFIAPM